MLAESAGRANLDRAVASTVARRLPGVLADCLGVAVPLFRSPELRRELRKKMRELGPLVRELERVESGQLTRVERVELVTSVLDRMLQTGIPGGIPTGVDGVEWLQRSLRKLVKETPVELRWTGYQRYMRTVGRLVRRLSDGGHLWRTGELQKDVLGDRAPFLAQGLLRQQRSNQRLARILKGGMKATLDDTEDLVAMYESWAGIYEKQLVLLCH